MRLERPRAASHNLSLNRAQHNPLREFRETAAKRIDASLPR